ncbi:hypothetical protein CYY_002969 [Polysphondylium violaceum]|uniref:TLDc domain-containing protein n=1 Tax=Polysphondylium violaceum TaxID=133409 RepID=A0A8J4PXP7_9MYCE|nr:hypothetical protein CYY_002969 [Polysphondylium violaceum]
MTITEPTQIKINEINDMIKELSTLLDEEINLKNEEIKEIEKTRGDILQIKGKIEASLVVNPINLNVGGVKFQTTKTTLTKKSGTLFDLMLSGKGDIKPMIDKPNTYYIDRNGTHFRYVLNYLRDGENVDIPNEIIEDVKKELMYYQITDTLPTTKTNLVKTSNYPHSKILDSYSFKTINDWIDTKTLKMNLLYRASENNFVVQSFHSECDHQGPTITLIETTDGCVFGGYNSQSWNSGGKWYGDDRCFIFTLVNKHGIKPTKYIPNKDGCYVYSSSNCGPTFGVGFDIHISSQPTQLFPSSYQDTTGYGKSTLTPSQNFTIKDYEVYQVV